MEKNIELMDYGVFKKSFFNELQKDIEKGLIMWKIKEKERGFAIECSADWRGTKLLIQNERERKNNEWLLKNSCSMNITSGKESLALKSADDKFTRDRLKNVIKEISAWSETYKTGSILKALNLESALSERGHKRHDKVIKKLEYLTIQGLQWKLEEGNFFSRKVTSIKCSAEYKGLSISFYWYHKNTSNAAEDINIIHIANSGFDWRIDTARNYLPDLGTDIYHCRKCRGLMEGLIRLIYRTYIIPERKEMARKAEEFWKKDAEEAKKKKDDQERKKAFELAEKIKKIRAAVFNK